MVKGVCGKKGKIDLRNAVKEGLTGGDADCFVSLILAHHQAGCPLRQLLYDYVVQLLEAPMTLTRKADRIAIVVAFAFLGGILFGMF
jgi:hypothetical protein